jgi:hypothetical protein
LPDLRRRLSAGPCRRSEQRGKLLVRQADQGSGSCGCGQVRLRGPDGRGNGCSRQGMRRADASAAARIRGGESATAQNRRGNAEWNQSMGDSTAPSEHRPTPQRR